MGELMGWWAVPPYLTPNRAIAPLFLYAGVALAIAKRSEGKPPGTGIAAVPIIQLESVGWMERSETQQQPALLGFTSFHPTYRNCSMKTTFFIDEEVICGVGGKVRRGGGIIREVGRTIRDCE